MLLALTYTDADGELRVISIAFLQHKRGRAFWAACTINEQAMKEHRAQPGNNNVKYAEFYLEAKIQQWFTVEIPKAITELKKYPRSAGHI
jgi:hypothetical protein